ncbi:MAG: Flp family type IVb pilin [Acidobacteriota bacterium]|nr:MAG: Flp family type IVb pilin [Acidobacteriota bacterium]
MLPELKQFLTEEDGQDVVEYSLVLVLVGTIAMIYLTGMGLTLTSIIQKIGNMLEAMSNSLS